LNRASRVRFETQECDELIEVRSADGVLLAAYLFSQDDLSEAAPHERSSIVLEGGQRISFSTVKNADGEKAGATIDLSYRETRLSRAAAPYLRRLGFTAGDPWREPRSAAWKPALTFAALLIVALGLIFYWRGREGAPREKMAKIPPPRTIETPSPPSPTPGA